MWSSLGSLRDRVRENAARVADNAKAAAHVAQGVIQAVAIEEDEPHSPQHSSSQKYAPPQNFNLPSQQHSSPPPPPSSDPNMFGGAPPPAGPPVRTSKAKRPGRYVVTGLTETNSKKEQAMNSGGMIKPVGIGSGLNGKNNQDGWGTDDWGFGNTNDVKPTDQTHDHVKPDNTFTENVIPPHAPVPPGPAQSVSPSRVNEQGLTNGMTETVEIHENPAGADAGDGWGADDWGFAQNAEDETQQESNGGWAEQVPVPSMPAPPVPATPTPTPNVSTAFIAENRIVNSDDGGNGKQAEMAAGEWTGNDWPIAQSNEGGEQRTEPIQAWGEQQPRTPVELKPPHPTPPTPSQILPTTLADGLSAEQQEGQGGGMDRAWEEQQSSAAPSVASPLISTTASVPSVPASPAPLPVRPMYRQRSRGLPSSSNPSEREKSLEAECEQKTAAIAALKRKLASASSKIEKLIKQKSTYHRQRDEAGDRLRAAGAEFLSLSAKLEETEKVRDKLQEDVDSLRAERDITVSKIEGLSEAQDENSVREQLHEVTETLENRNDALTRTAEELRNVSDENSSLRERCSKLDEQVGSLEDMLDDAEREGDILKSKVQELDQEKLELNNLVASLQEKLKVSEESPFPVQNDVPMTSEQDMFEMGHIRAELSEVQSLNSEQAKQILELQGTIEDYKGMFEGLHASILSSIETAQQDIDFSGAGDSELQNALSPDNVDPSADLPQISSSLVSTTESAIIGLSRALVGTAQEATALREERDSLSIRLEGAEVQDNSLEAKSAELASAQHAYDLLEQELKHVEEAKGSLEMHYQRLEENLRIAENRASELDHQLNVANSEMRAEVEQNVRVASEQRAELTEEIEENRSKLKSILNMLQKCLANQNVEYYSEGIEDENEEQSKVPVLALRATASIVAELGRNREAYNTTAQRLASCEDEVVRLTERAELAEHERDAFRSTNERLEKKSKSAFADGEEAAQVKLESLIAQFEDELEDTKQELKRVNDKAGRSETEAGELRALCNKLTSQLGGRTNELDEAEEKIVYLQDQVVNLEEDLQEAHRRLKEHEQETSEARRNDVNRLTSQLEETENQLEKREAECISLREAAEVAENKARESELLAETHQKAEENLQIAIEQLEAAQESAVEQRTIELYKKLKAAETRCDEAVKREQEVAMTENKMALQDDEIKELRGAIGRLADERVELKLELEKSLSRLNHPDAGGQLVDRRVVRQLLVSYFRVGSIRRRDVLELMSRMLAFSESDNIAVGLKRRALMDRIGSLVQAPEVDDARLPPLGTVSDKWIEFLMNETEAGDGEESGW